MNMNKTNSKKKNIIDDELEEHYDFDYSKAKPNRFAPILAEQSGFIKLQPDIQEVFKTSEQVNNILRAIISAYPKSKKLSVKTA
jgi:hypothetical protein